MTLDQVRALLRRECDKIGNQAAWAKAHGVSAAYVSDVLVGRREPGDAILRALGLVRVVTYQRARGEWAPASRP
jgi:DNA-binding transcriptional regulator YdaS (Cro superfamily)